MDSQAVAKGPSPFESLAGAYDHDFTESLVGTIVRRAIWRHLERAFPAGRRVLDIGCGTGEDALHLASRGVFVVGIDAAESMVRAARAKVAAAGKGASVELVTLDAERLAELPTAARLDGAYSSFGVLNCVADLRPLAAVLAERLAPGARVFLCLMGPWCVWEWAFYGRRGDFRKAFRRLRKGSSVWRGLTIRYPRPHEVARMFTGFRVTGVHAIGFLVPPSYAEDWARRHPRLLRGLDAMERRIESLPPFAALSDHYLLELVRT
jgi:SAM-dependent methyltransferase